jgi:hypothetical protein
LDRSVISSCQICMMLLHTLTHWFPSSTTPHIGPLCQPSERFHHRSLRRKPSHQHKLGQ